jgi:hypothetical protein
LKDLPKFVQIGIVWFETMTSGNPALRQRHRNEKNSRFTFLRRFKQKNEEMSHHSSYHSAHAKLGRFLNFKVL